MQSVNDFLKKVGAYYIATVDGDKPKLRPFGCVNIFEGKVYIGSGKKKEVSNQIAKNSNIAICAFDGKECLRLTAKFVEDDNIEAQKSMLEAYPQMNNMYKPGDGNFVVYYLKDVTATFTMFGSEPRVVKF